MTTTQTKECPILFSGPMVRAILEGRKTMTRRIVKLNNWKDCDDDNWPICEDAYGDCYRPMCRYGQPGDHLWVRETWVNNFGTLIYRADYHPDSFEYGAKGWKPSIFMPRALSRITLQITDVRVERLQNISEQDARQEGVSASDVIEFRSKVGSLPMTVNRKAASAVEAFRYLWETINGADSWNSDPWVWVVSFERI